jgi:hypothetical protein
MGWDTNTRARTLSSEPFFFVGLLSLPSDVCMRSRHHVSSHRARMEPLPIWVHICHSRADTSSLPWTSTAPPPRCRLRGLLLCSSSAQTPMAQHAPFAKMWLLHPNAVARILARHLGGRVLSSSRWEATRRSPRLAVLGRPRRSPSPALAPLSLHLGRAGPPNWRCHADPHPGGILPTGFNPHFMNPEPNTPETRSNLLPLSWFLHPNTTLLNADETSIETGSVSELQPTRSFVYAADHPIVSSQGHKIYSG